ncbi:MAG: hypothetical protein ACUVQ0_05500 [Thermoproteota archaeon]
MKGGREEIVNAVIRCIDLGISMIAPACALYPENPRENIRAMTRTVRKKAAKWGESS